MYDWFNKVTICWVIGLGVGAYWLFSGTSLPTGYIGRDGQYDVYCGYKPKGFGSSDYECEWEPAINLNLNRH